MDPKEIEVKKDSSQVPNKFYQVIYQGQTNSAEDKEIDRKELSTKLWELSKDFSAIYKQKSETLKCGLQIASLLTMYAANITIDQIILDEMKITRHYLLTDDDFVKRHGKSVTKRLCATVVLNIKINETPMKYYLHVVRDVVGYIGYYCMMYIVTPVLNRSTHGSVDISLTSIFDYLDAQQSGIELPVNEVIKRFEYENDVLDYVVKLQDG